MSRFAQRGSCSLWVLVIRAVMVLTLGVVVLPLVSAPPAKADSGLVIDRDAIVAGARWMVSHSTRYDTDDDGNADTGWGHGPKPGPTLSWHGSDVNWDGGVNGGATDCSGAVRAAIAWSGIDVTNLASADMGKTNLNLGGGRVGNDHFLYLGTDLSLAKPGDIIVWDGHVALVVEGGVNGRIVESGSAGVRENDARTSDKYGRAFLGIFEIRTDTGNQNEKIDPYTYLGLPPDAIRELAEASALKGLIFEPNFDFGGSSSPDTLMFAGAMDPEAKDLIYGVDYFGNSLFKGYEGWYIRYDGDYSDTTQQTPGDTSFTPNSAWKPIAVPATMKGLQPTWADLQIGDFTGDNSNDILWLSGNSTNGWQLIPSVYPPGSNDWLFGNAVRVSTSAASGNTVVFDDFNGDTNLDGLWMGAGNGGAWELNLGHPSANRQSTAFEITPNGGREAWIAGEPIPSSPELYAVAFVNVDGDDALEAVYNPNGAGREGWRLSDYDGTRNIYLQPNLDWEPSDITGLLDDVKAWRSARGLATTFRATPALDMGGETGTGDGRADLLIVDTNGDLIRYQENYTDEVFYQGMMTDGLPVGRLDTGNYLEVLTLDWNGDRIDDLVTRDDQGNLWLLLGQPNGFFGDQVQIATGWAEYDMIAGPIDWNKDFYPDIIVIKKDEIRHRTVDGEIIDDPAGRYKVYVGNGISAIPNTMAQSSWLGAGFEDTDALLAPGDLNLDGIRDFARVDNNGVLVSYLLDGDNGPSRWGMPKLNENCNAHPEQCFVDAGDTIGGGGWDIGEIITGGDLNRNGKIDIVYSLDEAPTVYQYTGMGQTSEWSSGPLVNLPHGKLRYVPSAGAPTTLHVDNGIEVDPWPPGVPAGPAKPTLDMGEVEGGTPGTGNGLGDVIVVGTNGDLVRYEYIDDGSGRFERVDGTVGALPTGTYLEVFSPGDWDGDRIDDLLARDISGDLWFLKGSAEGTFSDTPIKIAFGWQDYDFVTGPIDWNDDGYPDLMVIKKDEVRPQDGSVGRYKVYTSNGGSVLDDIGNVIPMGHTDWLGAGFDDSVQGLLAPGDLNHDGTRDIIMVLDGVMKSYLLDGNNNLTDVDKFTPPYPTFFRGTPGSPISTSGWWVGREIITVGDVNGDDDIDLVYWRPDGSIVMVTYVGTGGNESWAAPGSAQGLVAGRLRYISSAGGDQITIDNGLPAENWPPGVPGVEPTLDMDNDGLGEVLTVDTDGTLYSSESLKYVQAAVPENQTAVFGPMTTEVGQLKTGDYLEVFSPGDWDGDGIDDLLARDKNGDLWFYQGLLVATSPDTFEARFADTPIKIASGWQDYDYVAGPIDWNDDGYPDLMVLKKDEVRPQDGSVGRYKVYTSRGEPVTGEGQMGQTDWIGGGFNTVQGLWAPGDLNRDGTRDVIAIFNGTMKSYLLDGNNNLTDHDTFTPPYPTFFTGTPGSQISSTGWWNGAEVVTGGDLDDDGKVDLVYSIASTPKMVSYRGSGSSSDWNHTPNVQQLPGLSLRHVPSVGGRPIEVRNDVAPRPWPLGIPDDDDAEPILDMGDSSSGGLGNDQADVLTVDRLGRVWRFEVDASGAFQPGGEVGQLPQGQYKDVFSPGDWDGDRIDDLMARTFDGRVLFFQGLSDGTFSQTAVQIASGWDYDFIAGPIDWDDDGYPDIVVVDKDRLRSQQDVPGQFKVFMSNGRAVVDANGVVDPMRESAWLSAGWNVAQGLMAPGDLDQNGTRDFVLLREGTMRSYLTSGYGWYLAETGATISSSTLWNGSEILAPGDVNDNGKIDLVQTPAINPILNAYIGTTGLTDSWDTSTQPITDFPVGALRYVPSAGGAPFAINDVAPPPGITPGPAKPHLDIDNDGLGEVLTVDTDGTLSMTESLGAQQPTKFGPPTVVGQLETGTYREVFSPGDWDGDTIDDLLARMSDGRLVMFRGTEAGTFDLTPQVIATGWQGVDFVAGPIDWNSDGYPDIFVVDKDRPSGQPSYPGQFNVFMGNGRGGFIDDRGLDGSTAIGWMGAGWGDFTGRTTNGVWAPGDLNQDGTRDLILVWNNTMHAYPMDGNNTLGSYLDASTTWFKSGFGSDLSSTGWWNGAEVVMGGDLNGNGQIDLVYSIASTPKMITYIGTGTSNSWTTAVASDLPGLSLRHVPSVGGRLLEVRNDVAPRPWPLGIPDVDKAKPILDMGDGPDGVGTGDGWGDVLTVDRQGRVWRLQMTSSGSFQPFVDPVGLLPQGQYRDVFSPGDWDGDRIDDLMARTFDGRVLFFQGLPGGTFSETAVELASGWDFDFIAGPVDWDDDGYPDIVVVDKDHPSGQPSYPGQFKVFMSNGRAVVDANGVVDPPRESAWLSAGWSVAQGLMAPGDLDRNGTRDFVLLSGGTMKTYLTSGYGWYLTGTGNTISSSTLWTGSEIIAGGDLNGNGLIDLVNSLGTAPAINKYTGTGSNNLWDSAQPISGIPVGALRYVPSAGGVPFAVNDVAPPPGITPGPAKPHLDMGGSQGIGNGKADLLTVGSQGQLTRYEYTTSGAFAVVATPSLGSLPPGTYREVFSPGDWNGDYLDDLLARMSDGRLVMFKGTEAGTFDLTPVEVATGWGGFEFIAGPVDWNSDGYPDIFVVDAERLRDSSSAPGQFNVFLGNGDGGFIGQGADGLTVTGWMAAGWGNYTGTVTNGIWAPGDINRDGTRDLILVQNGTMRAYPMNGNLWFASGFGSQISSTGYWNGSEIITGGNLNGGLEFDLVDSLTGTPRMLMYTGTGTTNSWSFPAISGIPVGQNRYIPSAGDAPIVVD